MDRGDVGQMEVELAELMRMRQGGTSTRPTLHLHLLLLLRRRGFVRTSTRPTANLLLLLHPPESSVYL
jgi:hypothetical protein